MSSQRELDQAWGTAGRVVMRQPQPSMTLEFDERHGYRLASPRFGAFGLAKDGSIVTCAPASRAAWRWQRFLTGQVLPLAAVLSGLEVFHASAVVYGSRAAAFVGNSGDGKTSLATRLTLRGAKLLADDVLAVELGESGLVAHPGPALINLRHREAESLDPATRRRIGRQIGRDRKGIRIQVPPARQAVPLGTLYILHRGDGVAEFEVERLAAPDPGTLLAATFNFAIRTPARLRNQLDICAWISRQVPVFRLRVPSSVTVEELAGVVESHLLGLQGRGYASPISACGG